MHNVESQPAKKILIIAPAWIGDMVMAQSLFKFLKAQNPSVEIDVLAPSWTLPLVERMPEVKEAILFPFGHGELKLFKRYSFAKKLRRKNYDQAIVLPSSFKSALIVWWAKIPKRTGWLGEYRFGLLNDVRHLDESLFPLMVQRFIRLGLDRKSSLPSQLEAFYPTLKINEDKRQAIINKLQLTTLKPILALCPGAEFGPSKRWPVESFAAIANEMQAKGWQIWIFGSKKESSLAESIMALTKEECVDLTGKTSLNEAIDLMSLTNIVVSNDSGLMHIASALKRPMVVIYGSSSPNFTPPLYERVKKIKLGLSCSPCFKRTCPLVHFDCMKKITPTMVLSNIDSLSHD